MTPVCLLNIWKMFSQLVVAECWVVGCGWWVGEVPGKRIRLFTLAVDCKWALCLPSSLVSPIPPVSLLFIFLLFGKNFDDVGKVKSEVGWARGLEIGNLFLPPTIIEADGILGELSSMWIFQKFY